MMVPEFFSSLIGDLGPFPLSSSVILSSDSVNRRTCTAVGKESSQRLREEQRRDRIREYSELEETRKDHRVLLLARHGTPKNPTDICCPHLKFCRLGAVTTSLGSTF